MTGDSHKIIVLEYLKLGQRQKAINYLMQTYEGVDSVEAEKLIQNIESSEKLATSTNSSSGQGCAGCFGGLFKLASVLFMFIGLSMLIVAGCVYYIIKQEKLELVAIDAVVVDLQESRNYLVLPVLEYEWDGVVYTDTTEVAIDKLEFEIGQEIEVSINPHYPESAHLKRETDQSLYDLIYQPKVKDITDIQVIQVFYDLVTYLVILPGMFLILLSIVLWWASNRMTRKI